MGNNRSANYGVEGASDDPAIVAVRGQQMRNLLATLLCALGTPMILAGDEFGRTQQGNNNAYCQDNEISWVNWETAGQQGQLTDVVRRLTALRHEIPMLRQNRFLAGQAADDSGMKDVTWLAPAGTELTDQQWTDPQLRCFGMLLHAVDSRAPDPCTYPSTCLIIMNGGSDSVEWSFPSESPCRAWSVLFDTSRPLDDDPPPLVTPTFEVRSRSFLLLRADT
jgi:glycogen operon protein